MANSSSDPKKSGFALSALIMASGTMVSRILGLTRDIILLNGFDRTLTDAWLVAFRLPNLFRRLLGEGSLSNSFIPVYVEVRGESPQRANLIVRSIYLLLLCALAVCIGLGVLFCDPLIRLWVSGSGYAEIPGKIEMTVEMAQIMFLYLFAITHFAFYMAILNAHKKFAIPALAPCLFNIAIIVTALLPSANSTALAWGVVVGGFMQASLLYPYVIGLENRLVPKWSFGPEVKRILKNMLPGMLGMGTLQLTALINTALTSRFEEGSHTWIYSADRILEFPLSLIAVSIGAALLPTLSESWSRKDQQSFTDTLSQAVSLNLFLAIPAAIGLGMLSGPLVGLIYAWTGQVDSADIGNTASVLEAYSFLLVFASLIRILGPAYFAQKNTLFPAIVSALALLLHLLLAPVLMRSWGLNGLVYSVVISSVFNLTVLVANFHLRSCRLPFLQVGGSLVPMLPGILWVVVICLTFRWFHPTIENVFIEKMAVFGTIVTCVLGYLSLGHVFNVEYSRKFTARIFRR